MAVKLLMTWDILPGREQEYFEFVVRELIPGMQHMGLEPSDAWFTMYGDQPQILAIVQSSSMTKLEEVLASSEWDKITNQLMDYVEDLNYKVVPARTGFQL
jgi:hypothetical protein